MAIAFFVSSVGDTDLALATVERLSADAPDKDVHLIAITGPASSRIESALSGKAHLQTSSVIRTSLEVITQIAQNKLDQNKTLAEKDLAAVTSYLKENDIDSVYIGVPSPVDEEIPFQLAKALDLPCVMAYEYLFNAPAQHKLWQYFDDPAFSGKVKFAVATDIAREVLSEINPRADLTSVGHLSFKQATPNPDKNNAAKAQLNIKLEEKLYLISGTTQPSVIDQDFLKALLQELSAADYKDIQLRFGLHPGRKEEAQANYLQEILAVCHQFPGLDRQFKIVLAPEFYDYLILSGKQVNDEPFLMTSPLKGPDMAEAADAVAQAVPGALINAAVLNGKPGYFHDAKTRTYLDKALFSGGISQFFSAEKRAITPLADLGLKENVAENMARLVLAAK